MTSCQQTAKIGSLVDVTESADPEGLRVFYYLVQDLKALVFSLISLHFKVRAHTLKAVKEALMLYPDQAYLVKDVWARRTLRVTLWTFSNPIIQSGLSLMTRHSSQGIIIISIARLW